MASKANPELLDILAQSLDNQSIVSKSVSSIEQQFQQYTLAFILSVFDKNIVSITGEFNPQLYSTVPFNVNGGVKELKRIFDQVESILKTKPINGMSVKFNSDSFELYI